MTTNIFDGNAKVMASDSRWSIEYGPWLFYLDDTGYEKILRHNGFSLMFAGNGRKIQEYKDWIRSNPPDDSSMPNEKGMSVCMIEDATGEVVFQRQQDINSENVLCAGSGARWAFGCWIQNKCSKQAVKTAKSKDVCSGGDVKYVDFAQGAVATNVVTYTVQKELHIDTVTKNILERGNAMKIQALPPGTPDLPFNKADGILDVAQNEQAARAAAKALAASGQLTATAPCAGMHNDWDQDDRAEFKKALGKMFNWKN
jgi:hypothetical protein